MENKFSNPQHQTGNLNIGQNIELISQGSSIVLFIDYVQQCKNQTQIINLRGGGCGCSSQVSAIELEKTSHKDILSLILQRDSLNQTQELRNRLKVTSSKIPDLIEGNILIVNQLLSLLIFEQFGLICQTEFQQIQHYINPNKLELRGLNYEYEIMMTAFQKKQKIQEDENMKQLQKLQSNLNSVNDLINHIKNIELQLTVSESLKSKDYSFIMIYKLKYCFEKLFWIFFNQLDQIDIRLHVDNLYENLIVNSKSTHIHNQWITLISNLYFIRPVQKIQKQKYMEPTTIQLFRPLTNQIVIVLYEHIENQNNKMISESLSDIQINDRYLILNRIKNSKYLQYQIDEKKYFDNQIKIIQERLNKNCYNYKESEAICQLLEQVETKLQNCKNFNIGKLKNIYISIMIDCIRILIVLKSIYNQCILVKDFNEQQLQSFENLFSKIEDLLKVEWEKMIKIIFDKISPPKLELKIVQQLKKQLEAMLDMEIQVDFLKKNRQCLENAFNYQSKIIQNFVNVINQAEESLKNSSNQQEKQFNYIKIIITIELIQQINSYYLINLKQIFLQILNTSHDINVIADIIELFNEILMKESQIKNIFSNESESNNGLCQQQQLEPQDIINLSHLTQQQGDQLLNQNQQYILQKLKDLQNSNQQQQSNLQKLKQKRNQQQQINLSQNSDLETYNKFILFILQQLQYPQQFKLSEHNRRHIENLVVQLIKILSLCSETHIFQFALEILIDIQLENKYNKLMLDEKIVELIENLQNCIQVNIVYFKDQINSIQLDKINQKIVEQGIKQWQDLYVKNKIKLDQFQVNEQQLRQQFDNIFINQTDAFLKQFLPIIFNYKDKIIKKQDQFYKNELSVVELIELKQKMVLEQKYQDILQNKYILDLTCNSWNSSSNSQAKNLNQEIKNFVSEQQLQILIIFGEDCLGRITLAKQTEEFIWEKQNQTTTDIPITFFVDIENLKGDKIEINIKKYLNLKTERITFNNKNEYRFLFLIVIQEDQNTEQIIKSIQQMVSLILTNAYPQSKIICFIKSEILQCQEYQQMIQKQDKLHIVQLCIQKASIQEFVFIKFKNCLLQILRKYDILIDFGKFDRIVKNLELIIINNKNQKDQLVDVEVELILEFLDYHLSVEHKSKGYQEELKLEISKLKSLKYYQNKFNELSLNNHIQERFVLYMIFQFFSSLELKQNTQKMQVQLKKNLSYFLYQEALQNNQVNEVNISQKTKDYISSLDFAYYFQHLSVEKIPNQIENNNINVELIKNVENMKFTLYEIYLQYIQTKHQNIELQVENQVLEFYIEKAFQNAERNKITLDNENQQYLEKSIIKNNIENGYQFLHSTIQDFFISKFLLDFLINIKLPNGLVNYNYYFFQQL